MINTNSGIYSDYQETSDDVVNHNINKLITKHLNNGINLNLNSDLDHLYLEGFDGETPLNWWHDYLAK